MNPLLTLAIGAVALVYASVGHAGATGYIALMTLFGLDPQVIRPTALMLNVIVASIATGQFWRAGHVRLRLFLPLAVASVPAAAAGGAINLPTAAFEGAVGLMLLFSAVRIFGESRDVSADAGEETSTANRFTLPFMAALGGSLGLLSGLTGVGGGVFLTPALLALRAAPVKQVAAVSAPFILVNSLAGLLGGLAAGRALPPISLTVIGAVVLGGAVGSQLGAFRMSPRVLRLLMGVVLVVAGLKLLMKAGPLSRFELVEGGVGAEVNGPVDGGGGGEDAAVELVGGQQFVVFPGLDHEGRAVAVADVDLAVGEERR